MRITIFIFILIFTFQNTFANFKEEVRLVKKYCFDCHSDGVDKGNFEFDKLNRLSKTKAETIWRKVWNVVAEEQMPPADKKKQPSMEERLKILNFVEKRFLKIDRHKKFAAPISLSRMGTEQYGNTIRDLTAVSKGVKSMLPLDPTSAGFNNISATLNISPLLFERYEKIAFQMSRGLFQDSNMDSGLARKGKDYLKKSGDGSDLKKAEEMILYFARRAFRRPPTSQETRELLTLYKNLMKTKGHSYAFMETYRCILISPSFLYRTELFGTDEVEGKLARLDEYALASRLAFFLWNTSPDDKLLNLAKENKLRKNLARTVREMMDDWRFPHAIDSFGSQWLGIQFIENNAPGRQDLKYVTRIHLQLMKRETITFLTYLFKENRPLNDFISSRETFIEEKLAELYGVPRPKQSFGKVVMPESHRRSGILSFPSVLIVSSDPDRTSPVKRGLWILENVLGIEPPPAPANVDPIDPKKESNQDLSFRQQLEKHRENKACASCHAMMDPLGFAMENFDAVGKWRTKDFKGKKVDSATVWRGDKIKGFEDLQKLIVNKYRKKFLTCLTKKLLTYSLGRGIEIEDHAAIEEIVTKISHPDSTTHELLMAIISSTPFQYRSLDGAKK